jgi:hypothetical protein
MPRFLGIDANYLSGTVYFNNVKVVQVNFLKCDGTKVYFTKAPRVLFTPADQTSLPAFRTDWTGEMDWIIMGR